MRRLSRIEWIVLAFIITYSFIPSFGGLIRVLDLIGGPAIIPENPRAARDPFPIVLHILSSFLFCIVGAVQFLPSIKRWYPATHRAIGRVLVAAGCISAASGLWMTHIYTFPQELQGSLLYWVRMLLGSLMIGFIVGAVIAVKSRNIMRHTAMMVRAYAIAQGASTQTFFGITWIVLTGSEAMGPLRDGMMVGAWVLNLVVAEVLIKKLFAKNSRT
jgi:uncharacterized membrane protein